MAPWSRSEAVLAPGRPGEVRRFRSFLTDQLRGVLEDRSIRFGVLGTMLISASLIDLLAVDRAVSAGWMFIMPVAISAIAGGLREGLMVALCASLLGALYASAGEPSLEPALLAEAATARFALYGITAIALGAFAEAHYSVQSKLRMLAAIDPLTRVANVAGFYEELHVLESTDAGFGILLIDIDDLKSINDRHGHQTGSAAIQVVAGVLRRVVRTTDLVARVGGDEFAVVLKNADRPGAQIVANRIRSMLRDEVLPGAAGDEVGVSVGVAFFPEDGVTSEELLEVADVLLYREKGTKKGSLTPL